MSGLVRQVVADAPAGYWPMQGATLAEQALDIVAGRNISWSGATGGAAGYAGGKAVTLNGSGDYGSVASNAAFATTGSFSVMLAFTASPATSGRTLLGLSAGSGDPQYMTFDYYTSLSWGLRIGMTGSAGATNFRLATENMTPTTDRWYLMHGVWDNAAGSLTKYLDGAYVSTGVAGGGSRDNASAAAIHVGRYNNTYTQYWPGKVAHLAFFPSALTAARVQAHADAWRRQGVYVG